MVCLMILSCKVLGSAIPGLYFLKGGSQQRKTPVYRESVNSRYVAALWFATISIAGAQALPASRCEFDGFEGKTKLAEVVSRPISSGYLGCSPELKCTPTKVAAGDVVLVYRTEGDWTCGYLSQSKGAGPGWVRSQDLREVPAEASPAPAAWVGRWVNGEDWIRIQRAEWPTRLQLEGKGYWRGNGKVLHEGDFAGNGVLTGNQVHFVEGDADSCTVDLTLIGKYLVVNDNSKCGGMNVRFWGIWKKPGK
jgi:hypothetical protein